MECITNFSHEHPLSFIQVSEFEDPKPYKCAICGLPILHSPSYTCTTENANCDFFVHKPCAQLPRELYHDDHSDTLYLEQRTSEGESRQTFAYKCRNYSVCEFDLHPLAAKAVEIKSKHISHNSHPLAVFCREMSSQCNVCGEEQKGFFFYCRECDFWVHPDCTILPAIVKLRDRHFPYILMPLYSALTSEMHVICTICHGKWRLRNNRMYFCCETYDTVHVTCAKSKMEDLQTNFLIEELIKLPQEEDASPSLLIRRFAEINPSNQLVHHKNPLILVDGSKKSREAASGELVCDVCVQPLHISSPFYRCQSDGCYFLAHYICANYLPTRVQLLYPGQVFIAARQMQDSDADFYSNIFFSSVVLCFFCRRPSNGYGYCILKEEDQSIFAHCDTECVFSPKIIKHASHRQHLLFQFVIPAIKSSFPTASCCSGESLFMDSYRCVTCDFSIHIRCALLPNKTRHKFDEHPLELIMSHNYHNEEVFCQVCEQQIELKWWYYGCHECKQYFHINCIPSVGYLSKVKFGKTLADNKIHPNHPLTLTRMHTHQRHERCGLCNQLIPGFAHDQMAFHCSDCDFWVHFSCASATTEFLDYSIYQKNIEEGLRGLYLDDFDPI